NTIGGPDDAVAIPDAALDVDYEGELALVIARRAKEVPLEEALEYVGGYTILNDVSDRAWQRRQSQWALGKCFDGFAPLGPWVVTPDEVGDPQQLDVEVERDGVVTVAQSTSTTIFSAAYVVHYLSQTMTLEPGDVISTGTPQKLPAAQEAHRALVPGDAVTVRISRIGQLTTRFTASADAGARRWSSTAPDWTAAWPSSRAPRAGSGRVPRSPSPRRERTSPSSTAETHPRPPRASRRPGDGCTASTATSPPRPPKSCTRPSTRSSPSSAASTSSSTTRAPSAARPPPSTRHPTGTRCSPSTSTSSSTSRRPPAGGCSRR